MRIWAIVVAAVLFSGCSGDPRPEVPDAASPSDATSPTAVAPPPRASVPQEDAEPELALPAGTSGPTRTTFIVNGTTAWSGPFYGYETRIGYANRALDLFLPAETQGVVLELVWDSDQQDLDIEFSAPPNQTDLPWESFPIGYVHDGFDGYYVDRDGNAAMPDSPSRLELLSASLSPFQVEDCEPTEIPERGDCNVWDVGYRTKEYFLDLPWTLYVTVFIGEEPPFGFSAIPSSG